MNDTLQLAHDVRTQDYRRFLAIQRAPATARPALYALTAFNHEIASAAEIASEPMIAAIRLAWWREAIEEIASGRKPRAHPVVQALADAQVPSAPLLAMVAAREVDTDPALLPNEAAFLAYLDGTAGALHQLWAHCMGLESSSDIAQLSRAYAMIGLLHAIPFMTTTNVMRFPADLLAINKLTTMAQPGDALALFTRNLCEQAKQYLINISKTYRRLPAPFRALYRIAELDAQKLAHAGFDPYASSLARPRRTALVWKVLTA